MRSLTAAGLRLCLVLTALFALPAMASAQALRGKVIDEGTGQLIPQAKVSVLAAAEDSVVAMRVSDNGNFVIDLPDSGIFRVRVEVLGYTTHTTQAVAVPRGSLVTIELRIRAAAIALEPLRVIATRDEPAFMREVRLRDRAGFGQIVDREELDQRAGSDLREVLATVAGVRTTQIEGVPVVETRGGSGAGGAGRTCLATVYLNGVKQFSVDQMQSYGPSALEVLRDIFSLRPGDLEAIEVYRGAAEVPAEFSGATAECGVVAVWLRAGFVREANGDFVDAAPLQFQLVGTAAALTGGTKANTGFGIEGSAHMKVGTRFSLGVVVSRTGHQLPQQTMTYYTADLDPARVLLPSGARTMRIDGIGPEIRLMFRARDNITGVFAPRMLSVHRSFTLQDANVRHRTTRLKSSGTAIGASLSTHIQATQRGMFEIGLVAQHMAFDPYELLENFEKPTSTEWTSIGLRFGISYGIGN